MCVLPILGNVLCLPSTDFRDLLQHLLDATTIDQAFEIIDFLFSEAVVVEDVLGYASVSRNDTSSVVVVRALRSRHNDCGARSIREARGAYHIKQIIASLIRSARRDLLFVVWSIAMFVCLVRRTRQGARHF
jgi:hypothetical protein